MRIRLTLPSVAMLSLLLVVNVRGDELPKEAEKILAAHEQEVAAIQKKADDEIKARTQKSLAELQALQDTLTKAGKLDAALAVRQRLEAMLAGTVVALPDPGQLVGFRDRVGKILYFEVIGSSNGAVYGTAVYTDDSVLSTAAVHAGVLKSGEQGIVKVTVLPGQKFFTGSQRSGVTSSSWPEYPGSYKVEAGPRVGAAAKPAPAKP